MVQKIDLSHHLISGLQVYPGDLEVVLTPAASVASDGFAVTALGLGSHSGTHVDAPSHLVDGAATLDEVALSRFYGPARLVRVSEPAAVDLMSPDPTGGCSASLPFHRAFLSAGGIIGRPGLTVTRRHATAARPSAR